MDNQCQISCLPGQARLLRWGGAGLSDEQREEMRNREGVASGSATEIYVVFLTEKSGMHFTSFFDTFGFVVDFVILFIKAFTNCFR